MNKKDSLNLSLVRSPTEMCTLDTKGLDLEHAISCVHQKMAINRTIEGKLVSVRRLHFLSTISRTFVGEEKQLLNIISLYSDASGEGGKHCFYAIKYSMDKKNQVITFVDFYSISEKDAAPYLKQQSLK